MNKNINHIPVLLDKVLKYVKNLENGVLIDATFGLGGYSEAFLKNSNCQVFAVDRDPDVELYANRLTKKYDDRFLFRKGKFSELSTLVKENNIGHVIGITFDLGISNLQIRNYERGFSFKGNGPLDMRMSKKGENAEDFLKKVDEKTLNKILLELGEEKYYRRITRKILAERKLKSINSTSQLASLIRKSVPGFEKKIDKATKSFQAIRMHINDEIKELYSGLRFAETILEPNGILAVVSFHSVEDRIVKKFFSKCSGKVNDSTKFFPKIKNLNASFDILTKKPIVSDIIETSMNPSSRSAKLRVAKRTNSKPIHENAA